MSCTALCNCAVRRWASEAWNITGKLPRHRRRGGASFAPASNPEIAHQRHDSARGLALEAAPLNFAAAPCAAFDSNGSVSGAHLTPFPLPLNLRLPVRCRSVTSVPNPKSASSCSALRSGLWIREDTSKSMILVWIRFRSSLEGLAGKIERTSEPPH